jgi:hypothetical protein
VMARGAGDTRCDLQQRSDSCCGVCVGRAAGGVWGGAAAYVTVAVGFGMGVSYAALLRATAWTLVHNHLDP